MQVMHFRSALRRILQHVLVSNPHLGTVYISRVDLAYTCMRLWVRMEDVPSVTFLIQKKTTSEHQLVGFKLSLPMGYTKSDPYFCMVTNKVADLDNKEISQNHNSGKQPLEEADGTRSADNTDAQEAQADAGWDQLPDKQQYSARRSQTERILGP